LHPVAVVIFSGLISSTLLGHIPHPRHVLAVWPENLLKRFCRKKTLRRSDIVLIGYGIKEIP
jgi:hypothetical protein